MDHEQLFLKKVAAVTTGWFVVCAVVAIAGVCIAILSDSAFGSIIVATALFTAFLTACIAVPANNLARKRR